MKNFIQFMIPILIIGIVGIIMVLGSQKPSDNKKLYIKCDGKTKSFEIYSGKEISYMDDSSACHLDLEMINVDRNYLKMETPYLWRLNIQGEIDETEAKSVNIVESNEELILYSYDQKTKFIFQYK